MAQVNKKGMIESNLKDVEKQLNEKLAVYQGIIVTEDTITQSKKDVAEIRKIRTSIDDARKDLKKEWMKPFEQFEIINISSELIEAFEYHAVKNPTLFNEPWDKRYVYMLIYEMKYGDYKNMKQFKKDLNSVMEDKSIYAGPILKNADVTRTHKLLGKEG